jgi:uncharacterized membrane protein YphA (DoxX/SURF4 family)
MCGWAARASSTSTPQPNPNHEHPSHYYHPRQHRHHALKLAARWSVGFVWIWEGLVPKVLHPSQIQLDMVARSGWWWGSPEQTLHWLGIAMMVAGALLCLGIKERLGQLVATIAVLVLMVLVISNHPAAVHDPFGGLAKDACLFTCSALVWVLGKR